MRYFIACTLFLLQSCSYQNATPEYITLLDQTTLKFNQNIGKEHQLRCSGYGGSLMDDISMVSLDYEVIKKSDIPGSRQLLVFCVDKLATLINADAKLQPFLHETPFPANRIKLGITFVDKKGDFISDGTPAYIFTLKGKIYYSKYDPVKKRLEDLWEEDYAEALRIVQSETPQGAP